MCPESPCVWQSQSQDPGVLFPDQLSVHGPMLLGTSMAAASSMLGFCPVHPRSAQTCPVPLRRALTAAESVSSSARWGRGARDPGPSQRSLSLIFPVGSTKGQIPNGRTGNGNPEGERGRSGSTAGSTVTCGPASRQVAPEPWSGLPGDEP